MQKVINVNLNGNAYQLDEDAYAALRAYLDRAEAALRDNPDKAEIIGDLEQAIAEKCARFLTAHKTVVTASEMEQVLKDMGPVEGTSANGQAKSDADGAAKDGPRPTAPKRLYQIREGAMITGVCNGLAAYFDIDVTIVRIAFVILTVITKGAWVVVYGVMMLVVPRAETSEDRAAARGVPFNAQEVVDRAKKLHAEFAGKDWRRHWRHKNREMRREIRHAMRAPRPWHPYDVPGAFFAGLLTPVFGLINGVLFLMLAYAIYSLATQGHVSGWTIPAGMPFAVAIVILVILYGVVTSPLSAARHASMSAYGYYPAFAVWSGVVWLGIVAWLVWFGSQYQPEIREFIQNLPTYWQNFLEAVRR